MIPATPRRILITGASSGIGAALARAYAEAGAVLHLGGRDEDRLSAVGARCREWGAKAFTRIQDVTDRSGMARWIAEAHADGGLDLVIANAGVSGRASAQADGNGAFSNAEGQKQVQEVMTVNIDGVVNTVFPALEHMLANAADRPRGGQIAIMSSLAGYRGFSDAPGYCASKAAVKVLGEGLRGMAARHGIGVTVICPGFIRTPMTENNPFPMPFLMESDRAAAIIKTGLARNRARISFPWPLAAMVWCLAALPPSWVDALSKRVSGEPAAPRRSAMTKSR